MYEICAKIYLEGTFMCTPSFLVCARLFVQRGSTELSFTVVLPNIIFILWLFVHVVDVDTRRRAACDLVRALSKTFEDTVIQNFSVYVQHMLQVNFRLIHMFNIYTCLPDTYV